MQEKIIRSLNDRIVSQSKAFWNDERWCYLVLYKQIKRENQEQKYVVGWWDELTKFSHNNYDLSFEKATKLYLEKIERGFENMPYPHKVKETYEAEE